MMMLRTIYRYCLKPSATLIRNNSHTSENILIKESSSRNPVPTEIECSSTTVPQSQSVLEPADEDISHISTYLKPTFNFAAYVNKSETLQELLKLGVNFHKLERNEEAVPFILSVKFEDIREHVIFLKSFGLETEEIGNLITKNPAILKEDLEDLKVRINYLECKKFTNEMITRIVTANPFWLTHSTQQIDKSLGFFQNNYKLTGAEVRLVAVKCPKLITTDTEKVKLRNFVLKEEMGFTDVELKTILLKKPAIFIKGEDRTLRAFEYLHRDMNIPLERIVEEPEILTCRRKRLMERHLFLVKLGRAQYDPKKPNYVALKTLVSVNDSIFCTEIAKSSIQAYNAFLKSL